MYFELNSCIKLSFIYSYIFSAQLLVHFGLWKMREKWVSIVLVKLNFIINYFKRKVTSD